MKKITFSFLFVFIAIAMNAYEVGEFAYTKVAKYKITGENLVVNGKFTEGDTGFGAGWVATDAANAPLESVFTMVTGGPNGSNTQKVIDGQTDLTKGMYQKIAISAGGTYVVSFQVLGTTAAFTDLDMTGGNTNYMAAYYNTDAKDSLATVDGTNLYYGTNGVCGAYQFSFGTTFTPVAFAVEAPAEGYIIIDFRGLNAGVEIADVECHLAEIVYDDRIARDRIAYFQKYLVSEGIAEREFYEDFELAVAEVEAGLEAGVSPENMAGLMENLENVWAEFTAVNFENVLDFIATTDGSSPTGNNSANWMNWTTKWNKLSNDYNGKAPWSWTTDRWCHKTAAADSPMAIQWMRGAGANDGWNNIATLTVQLYPGTYYWGVTGQGGMMTLNKNRWARSWANECAETKLFFNGDTILVDTLNAARNTDYVVGFKLKEKKNVTLGIVCNNVSTLSEYAGFDVQFYSPVFYKLNVEGEKTIEQYDYIERFLATRDFFDIVLEDALGYCSDSNDSLPWGKDDLYVNVQLVAEKGAYWGEMDTTAILVSMDDEVDLIKDIERSTVYLDSCIWAFNQKNLSIVNMYDAIHEAKDVIGKRYYSSSVYMDQLQTLIIDSEALYEKMLVSTYSNNNEDALVKQKQLLDEMVEIFKQGIKKTTIVDIDFNEAIVIQHEDPEGLKNTYYTIDGIKGTMKLDFYANGAVGTTMHELGYNGIDSLGMLRVGRGAAVVDFSGVPVTSEDIVSVTFDLYFGSLTYKKVGYKLLTAEGDTICGLYCSRYSGTDDINTFGVDYSKKIAAVGSSSASNAAIAASSNKTSFEIVLDYGLKIMYCVTSGSRGTVTTDTIAIPEGKVPSQFVLYSDYNNSDRRCWFDNLKILNIGSEQDSTSSELPSTEYLTACENLKALVAECDSLFAVSPVANLAQVLTTAKMFVANIENASLAEVNLVSQNLQKVRDAVVMMDMLVTRSDVKLTVTNDPTYPWKLDVENQCITNSNNIEDYTSSQASFSFKSDKKTEIKMDWACYNHGNHKLELYVDGTLEFITQKSSYNTLRFYLDAGEHVISVRDTLGYTYYNEYEWSRIKNLSIKEIRPLEDSLLTAKSERITFENDGEYPWTWEEGYAQSSNYGHAYSASKFSTTFTIEEPSKFSFDVCVNSYYYEGVYHNLVVNINKEKYGNYSTSSWYDSSTGWIQKSVLLEPGKYTIEFLDSVNTSNTTNLSRLRNVELHSDWLEIDLASAGTLGAEVLYQVDVLGDVELLRVKGTLNAEDWTTINNMDNLVGLDLTGARFDAVPDYAFDGQSYLSSVKLPEGMTSIGQYAFRGTQIWKIQIPATVTSIGQYAFASTRLEEITFPENSQLTTIGFRAFGNCASLKEFIMPNTVTVLKEDSYGDSEAFYQCTSLKKLHFSDALTRIPDYTCYECYRLSDVHWPKGLVSIGYQAFRDVDDLCSLEFPETLTSIGGECFWSNNSLTHVVLPAKLTSLGDNAFIYSEALKYIEFPSYVERYYRTLYGCIALDTIVCHAPTPPAVASDILSGGRAKSDVTLIVPAFSAVSYKLDSYWYQYGNIVASEEVQDYWRVAGDLALTNNRRMGGKPDIDLYYNGRMLVGGDAAFEAGIMNFFINESQPARLLNNCPTVNVDSVNTYYSVNANTWYFFTPLYDVKVSDVTMSNDASYVIRYYDGAVRASAGTGSSWTDVPKDSVLLAGQGYIFRCNKACVVNIPADRSVHAQLFDFAAKEIALETHETETEANRNWNYVGNPYPCYYDIWYMDFTAPITVWTGSTYAAYSVTDDDFVLRPMQSFFVQKPDGVDSIRFRTEGRQLTNTVAHASYAARSTAPRFVFNLEIGTDSVADRTRVVFNATRSMDYELACDASKFMSMDATVPQIYSLDDKGNRLAINERPKADGRVALGVYVAQAGEYTLSASRMDGKAILYDALTDSYTDLSETSYTFRAEGTGYIEDRFELMLEVPGGATGIDETGADTTVKVTVKEGFIRVSGAEGTVVQLYSIDGKQLQSQTISGGNVLFVVPADGVYVVTANGVSQKAVVQEGWR